MGIESGIVRREMAGADRQAFWIQQARVAKSADAKDLKSNTPQAGAPML